MHFWVYDMTYLPCSQLSRQNIVKWIDYHQRWIQNYHWQHDSWLYISYYCELWFEVFNKREIPIPL